MRCHLLCAARRKEIRRLPLSELLVRGASVRSVLRLTRWYARCESSERVQAPACPTETARSTGEMEMVKRYARCGCDPASFHEWETRGRPASSGEMWDGMRPPLAGADTASAQRGFPRNLWKLPARRLSVNASRTMFTSHTSNDYTNFPIFRSKT